MKCGCLLLHLIASYYSVILGVWNPKYNKVVYPYSKNDYTARTHEDYLKSAREAVKKSKGRKQVATDGIKGLSCLFKIFNYPCQIIFDYMHLVCLCHIPSVIHRWCQRISKSSIQDVDQSLKQLRTPHNIKVVFLESIQSVNLWKAKNSRLFVLYVGVPIMTNRLPTLLFSHFIIYSLAIKLLHTPQSEQDILLGERLLHYYCRTIANIYDSSMEIFSLHAHIHLGHQVRLHGGLAHTSAFAFESAIRYIKKSAHGSINIASQIAYWNNLRCTTQLKKFNLAETSLIDIIIMSNRNISTRSCTLNRRPVEHSEVYHVIIFPCDNSFSVVKSKQCSPAEQDGFVFVQSGQKKYMGFIFATGKMDVDHQTMAKLFFDLGNFEMCSKVADRLCQKRHEEIESDYERQNENTRPKEATSNTPEKTYTTLKDVPLSIDIPVAVVHQASSRQIVSNFTTTTNSATHIISNNLPLSSPVRETSLTTTKKSSTTASSSNLNGRNRSTVDWSPSPSHNKKKKRSVKNQKDNVSSSDIESDDEDLIRTNEIIKTPTFTGRRITNSITTDCVTKVPIDAESYFRQMEK
ncbi:unnamed protein product [Rotaria magnacalcarata]